MSTWQKGLKWFGNALFAIIVVFMVVVVAFMVKGKMDGGVPSVGPYQLYVVLSGSMNPTFDTGSLIAVEPAEPGTIKLKDIITFKSPEDEKMIITHRVQGIMKLETGQVAYLTQGDANNAPDQKLVPAANVIGKAEYWVPYVGYVTHYAHTKKGLFVMIVIPGVLIIGSEMWKLFKMAGEYEEEKKQKAALSSEGSEDSGT